jgi:hypothetical protein
VTICHEATELVTRYQAEKMGGIRPAKLFKEKVGQIQGTIEDIEAALLSCITEMEGVM